MIGIQVTYPVHIVEHLAHREGSIDTEDMVPRRQRDEHTDMAPSGTRKSASPFQQADDACYAGAITRRG
jgi:hypothetical protein